MDELVRFSFLHIQQRLQQGSIKPGEEKWEDKPYSIRDEKEKDELVPCSVSQPMAAIGEGSVLQHVENCLPEGEGAHEEGNQ